MPAETASPFSKAAHDLIARGFHIVPIAPKTEGVDGYTLSGKAPGERRGASWRGIFDWQRFRDRKPSTLELEIWGEWAGVGIGIVLGSRCGDYQVIAVDIDAGDPDAVEEIRRVLPYSPMIKRGMKGMTLFYRADPAMTTRQYKVGAHPIRTVLAEILTGNETRQTVVPPTIHPDTGKPYVWVAGGTGVKAGDLPVITSEDVEALEETLHALGWRAEPIKFSPHSQIIGGSIDADTPFARLNAEALANLDAWVPSLDLYNLRRARGGYECVATWRGSSTGRAVTQRARNLSIQPNGIKDFGDDRRYSALDLVMAARTCSFDDAFAWLSDAVQGDAKATDGETLKAPPRVKAELPPHDPETGELIEVAPPEKRKPHNPAPGFPDELCFPPGLVGAISRWIVDTAMYPLPQLALAAAVSVVGTAMGRQYMGPTRSGTHFYALGLAPTGGGKDHPLQQALAIMRAADMALHIGPSEFISGTAAINKFQRRPLCLCCMDELAVFLSRINNPKGGNFERQISSYLRTAWGRSFKELPTPEWAQKESSSVLAPAMSLLGASTPPEFFAALTGMETRNGLLNRFIIFPANQRVRPGDPKITSPDVPAGIVEGLKLIYATQGPMTVTWLNDSTTSPDKYILKSEWDSPQAAQLYKNFRMEIFERGENDEQFMSFWIRAAEYACRLAHVRAVGRVGGNANVNYEDMRWGIDVARASFAYMLDAARDYLAEGPEQARAKEVLRLLKAAPAGIKRRDLLRALDHKFKARDLNDTLSGLVEAEAIFVREIPTGGRPAHVYFLRETRDENE